MRVVIEISAGRNIVVSDYFEGGVYLSGGTSEHVVRTQNRFILTFICTVPWRIVESLLKNVFKEAFFGVEAGRDLF